MSNTLLERLGMMSITEMWTGSGLRGLGLAMFASSLLVGCGSDSAQTTTSVRASDPAIGPAPASLVEISASVMVPEGSGPAVSATTFGHTATGTPTTVALQDSAGSGAYQFATAEPLVFTVGQVVNFTLESETEFHTFTVDDLNIDVPADAGEKVEFYFEFTEPGRYDLICVPHEAEGMVGTITVLP